MGCGRRHDFDFNFKDSGYCMRSPVSTAVAIGFGLITLVGYLLPPDFADIRALIVGWAVILVAVASLVAIISLVQTHMRKMAARRNPDRYSVFTLLFFTITFLAGSATYITGAYRSEYQQIFVNSIQVPVEATLMAVLAVTLTLASFRLFQRRRGLLTTSFVVSALVFLLVYSGATVLLESFFPDDLTGVLLGIVQILPVAGGRGILLGIALGSIMAGLRILFGVERPYSG